MKNDTAAENVSQEDAEPVETLLTILRWANGLTDFTVPPADRPGNGLVYPVTPGFVSVYREPNGCSVVCRYSTGDPMPPLAVGAMAEGGNILAVGRLDRTGRVSLNAGTGPLRVRIAPVVRDALDADIFLELGDRHAQQQLELARANRRLLNDVQLQSRLNATKVASERPGTITEQTPVTMSTLASAARPVPLPGRTGLPRSIAIAAGIALFAVGVVSGNFLARRTQDNTSSVVASDPDVKIGSKSDFSAKNDSPGPNPGIPSKTSHETLVFLSSVPNRTALEHLKHLDREQTSAEGIAKAFAKEPVLKRSVEALQAALANPPATDENQRRLKREQLIRGIEKLLEDLQPPPRP